MRGRGELQHIHANLIQQTAREVRGDGHAQVPARHGGIELRQRGTDEVQVDPVVGRVVAAHGLVHVDPTVRGRLDAFLSVVVRAEAIAEAHDALGSGGVLQDQPGQGQVRSLADDGASVGASSPRDCSRPCAGGGPSALRMRRITDPNRTASVEQDRLVSNGCLHCHVRLRLARDM